MRNSAEGEHCSRGGRPGALRRLCTGRNRDPGETGPELTVRLGTTWDQRCQQKVGTHDVPPNIRLAQLHRVRPVGQRTDRPGGMFLLVCYVYFS